MTPHPQKEKMYLVTENELKILSYWDSNDIELERAARAIRSRPHQPAAPEHDIQIIGADDELVALSKQNTDDDAIKKFIDYCKNPAISMMYTMYSVGVPFAEGGDSKNWLQQHDATIRNQTLKELQAWRLKRMNGMLKKDVWIAWNEETDRINESLLTPTAQQHERGEQR